jgi:hypothetical protein
VFHKIENYFIFGMLKNSANQRRKIAQLLPRLGDTTIKVKVKFLHLFTSAEDPDPHPDPDP